MALADRDFFTQGTDIPSQKRIYIRGSHGTRVGTLAAQSGAPTLPYGCPLAFDESVSHWTVYTQPSDAASFTIMAGSTAASGGTFLLIVDGLAVQIAFDATAAQIQAEVNAVLADAGKSFTVAAVATTGTDLGDNDAVVTLTFSEDAGAPSVELDDSDLTGAAHVLAAVDAGTQLNGTDRIRGFVGDGNGLETDASGEVQVLVIVDAELHRDDINTAAMRAFLGGSPSEGELDTALKDPELRKLRLDIVGLAGVR